MDVERIELHDRAVVIDVRPIIGVTVKPRRRAGKDRYRALDHRPGMSKPSPSADTIDMLTTTIGKPALRSFGNARGQRPRFPISIYRRVMPPYGSSPSKP
jgi:hypothetical protein